MRSRIVVDVEKWKAELKAGAHGLFLETQDAQRFLDEREALLSMLREIEWAGDEAVHRCPVCGGGCAGYSDPEHKDGCRLAALLYSED